MVNGYGGTPHGHALSTLLKEGFLELDMGFGGDMGLLKLTQKGISEAQNINPEPTKPK